MQNLQRVFRAARERFSLTGFGPAVVLVVFFVISGSVGLPTAFGQLRVAPFGNPNAVDPEQANSSPVYLPTDRALSRSMTRARERIAAGEYQESLTFLDQVVTREEDSFLEEGADAPSHVGLKAAARKMIGELPAEGRDAYERLFGPAARRQLDAAASAGDRVGVAQVVRQYFHTAAGYEAAFLLAQMESDAGHFAATGQLYRDLLDSPRAVTALEPQLSTLAAINHVAAGRAEQAAAALRGLIERDPNGAVDLGGKPAQLPGARGDVVGWLTERTGRPERVTFTDREWATLHGNGARNARHDGGGPHLRTRWQARVVNDPTLEDFLTNRSRQFGERNIVLVPAAKPIAVGNVVLMRTPSNVVAVDWQTGKRIWETRDDDGFASDQLLPTSPTGEGQTESSTPSSALEQRLWDDSLAMSLSSDGERAYVIRGHSMSQEEAVLAMQIPFMAGGLNGFQPPSNQLSAYELATEGKLAWELDGDRAGGDLAGAFFLGAPLAVENTLYVLAEVRSAVYLVALDPQTGKTRWQQQLIGLEQGISLDMRRRMAGCSPSYSGGVLVCPTSAGATVAVDVVRRELAWVYEYSKEAKTALELQMLQQQQLQQLQNQMTRSNDSWLDSAAVIDDGRVFLTPPESQELHCIDLRTGAMTWKKIRQQGDLLFVGCVDKGTVLLVGSAGVEGVRAVDGAVAWQEKTLTYPDGSRPAGQGYFSEGRYHLPLTSGAVMAIDVATGKQVSLATGESGTALGNLICVRGSVISQSPLAMDKFEQIDVLAKRAESALAKNSNDATAIRELAEMKRLAGRPTEAVALLKRAQELAPNDPVTREMLVEYLLDALTDDFEANKLEVPLLRRLVAGQPQEVRLLRIEARALEDSGDVAAAWDAYSRLATLDAQPALLWLGENYAVRSDRWLAGRMASLWATSKPADQAALSERVAAAARALGTQPGSEALRQFVARYGALPPADVVRLHLARRQLAGKQYAEAELEILQLTNSQVPGMKAAAAALLTQELVECGKYDAAVTAGAKLMNDGEWADVVVLDGLPGRQWIDRLAAGSPGFARSQKHTWPRGRVTVQNVASAGPALRGASPQIRELEQSNLSQTPTGFRMLRIEQQYADMADGARWFISTDGSQLVGRNSVGDDFAKFALDPSLRAQVVSENYYLHGARVGQLLIASLRSRIMAIDARQEGATEEGDVLWQAYPMGKFAGTALPRGRVRAAQQSKPVYNSSSDRRRETNPLAAGCLGPATPRGVVFYEQGELKCVEPLTGEMLWRRKDIPRNCELFGDDEFVCAADAKDKIIYVLKLIDGETVSRVAMPEMPWMLTAGRNVARVYVQNVAGGSAKTILSIFDGSTGKIVFEANFLPNEMSKVTVVEPNLLGIYERTGKFQLIDVRQGKILVDQTLEALASVQNIRADVLQGELVLGLSSEVQTGKHVLLGADYAGINGLVYAFSLATGQPLWPGPAVVRERFWSQAAPAGLPLLVFAEIETQRGAEGGNSKLRLLCLDRRTGQAVYRNDDLPNTASGQFRVRVDRPAAAADGSAKDVIEIEMSAREIRLTPTDESRPPEPPAQDDFVAAREFTTPGMSALFERATKALEESQKEAQGNRGRRGNRRGQ